MSDAIRSDRGIVELRSRYEAGERDFQGFDLAETSMDREDLVGVNLKGTQLERARLRGANLRNAYLADANLRCADLRGTELTDACLADADLRGASLDRAVLRGANLEGANFRQANFQGANLRGANLSGADIRQAKFEDTDLRNMDLSGADLSGVVFDASDLRSVNFANACMVDSRMRSVDLDSASLSGADLRRSDLSGANLVRANLAGANLARASLVDAHLDGANLEGANLRGANLEGADLRGARVTAAQLARARTRGALFDDSITSGRSLLRGDVTRGALLLAAVIAGSAGAVSEFAAGVGRPFAGWPLHDRILLIALGVVVLCLYLLRCTGKESHRGAIARYLPRGWKAYRACWQSVFAALGSTAGALVALITGTVPVALPALAGLLCGFALGRLLFRLGLATLIQRAQLCELRTEQRRYRRRAREDMKRDGATPADIQEVARSADTRIALLDQQIQVIDLGGRVSVASVLTALGPIGHTGESSSAPRRGTNKARPKRLASSAC